MQSFGRKPFLFGEATNPRKVVLMLLVGALALLQGCGGNANPNYPAATTQNPNPGVTLQRITITPANSIILLAEARQLFATGVYSDGSSIDITSQVTWSASSGLSTNGPSATNFVNIDKNGKATAVGIGATVISASVGTVTGLLQLVVSTNGFTSSTMGILSVPFKTSEIDVAYLPQQSQIQGAYPVQEVNLDADQFSSIIPPPVALVASIPMPSGYTPNAIASSQATSQVAVISYSSPDVQIIDASNNPLDVASNTLTATFKAPVSSSVTIHGITCMICAAVVNPLNNQLILSTAQGFYSMDFTSGTFTAMPFTPAPAPSANFSLNPSAAKPYIVSTNPANGSVQILDLTTNAVTTYPSVSPEPVSAALDVITNYLVIADGTASDQPFANLAEPQNAQIVPLSGVGVCSATRPALDMVAFGVSANPVSTNTAHTLFSTQTEGNCAGFEIWPNSNAAVLNPANIPYGYGAIPATPDGKPFVNGKDPNAIATFTSVVDKKNYGVLVDANEQWVAKINFATVFAFANIGIGSAQPLPAGALIPPADLGAGVGGDPITFLPSPSTNLTLSLAKIDFGSVAVGTLSPQILVTLSNIGAGTIQPQIALQGDNANDFSLISNCSTALFTQTSCTVYVTFAPTAKGPRSAVLNVTASGLPPQSIPLTGTGS